MYTLEVAFGCLSSHLAQAHQAAVIKCSIVNIAPASFEYLPFVFFLDCTLPFLLQHHGDLTVVSHPFHASTHQVGQRAGQPYGKVPLVCRPLPHPVFPDPPSDCVRPVGGWLAGAGWCRCAHHCAGCLRDHCQCDAVSLSPLPARGPAQLGLLAQAPALPGTNGQRGDLSTGLLWQTLLLLQML